MTCLEAFRRRRAPFGAVARLPAEERERGKGLHPQSLSSIINKTVFKEEPPVRAAEGEEI